MEIQGSLQRFSLEDVLMSLSMNQQTGTLTFFLTSGKQKHIYFLKGAIYVLWAAQQEMEELEKILLRTQRLSPRQLKTARQTQKQKQQDLGGVLLSMGALSEPELLRLYTKFVEDTLFLIYLDPQATFQFKSGVTPPDYTPPTPLIQRANSYVLTCFQNMHQWAHLRQFFPTLKEVLCPKTDLTQLSVEGFSQEELQELRHLSLCCPLEKLFEVTFLSRLRLLSLLSHLLAQGHLSLLPLDQAFQLAKQKWQSQKLEEAKWLFEYIETQSPQMAEFYFAYGQFLEKQQHPSEAVQKYRKAADLYFEQGQYDQVLQIYMRILSLDSANIGVLEKLFDAYLRSAKKEETRQVGLRLGALLVQQGEFSNAVLVYSHLAKLFPREVEFRKALAHCYKQLGDKDKYTQQMNIIRQIEQEKQRKKKEKLKRWARRVALLLFLLLLLAAGWFGKKFYEKVTYGNIAYRKAKTLWELFQKEVKNISPAELSEEMLEEKCQEVEKAWGKAAQYGYDVEAAQVMRKLEEWRKKLKEKLALYRLQRQKFEQLLKEEKKALERRDYQKLFALRVEKLEKFAAFLPKPEVQAPLVLSISPPDSQVWIDGEKASPHPSDPKLYFYRLRPSKTLVEVKVRKKGYAPYKLILNTPFTFASLPPISLLKESLWQSEEEIGFQTPPLFYKGTLYLASWNGLLYYRTLSKEKRDFNWTEIAKIGVKLSPPLKKENQLFWGTSYGELLIFSPSTEGVQRLSLSSYPFFAPPLDLSLAYGQATLGLLSAKGDLYVVSLKPSPRFLEKIPVAEDGALAYPLLFEYEGTLYLVTSSPHGILRCGKFLPEGKKKFHLLWQIVLPENISSPMLFYQDLLLVGGDAGTLYVFSLEEGQVLLTYNFGGKITSGIQIAEGEQFFLGTAQPNKGYCILFSLDLEKKKVKIHWKYPTLPVVAPPTLSEDGKTIYVPTAVSYRQAQIRTRDSKIQSGRILHWGKQYILFEDSQFQRKKLARKQIHSITFGKFQKRGALYVLSLAKKQELWSYPLLGAPLSPLLTPRYIVVGTDQGEIVCFSR